ncbi:flagellar protein FlaG [Robertmurraya sp. Marseille-Q9965]
MSSVDSISRLYIDNTSFESSNSSKIQENKSYNLEQQPEDKKEVSVKEKDMENIINDINTVLGNTHTSLKYVYHEKLKSYYVTLVNDKTKETVREIPPKKLLDIYASMKDYLGLFVDSKI